MKIFKNNQPQPKIYWLLEKKWNEAILMWKYLTTQNLLVIKIKWNEAILMWKYLTTQNLLVIKNKYNEAIPMWK